MNSCCQSFSEKVGSLLSVSTSEDFVVLQEAEAATILSDTEINFHLSVTETCRIQWNSTSPYKSETLVPCLFFFF